jgi:16S rRNA (adenine1518-N6/adenine1519-N6)-dimethyltransferase
VRLDSLPPLRDVIATHDLRAEKKLGQNFLLDRNITDKIARAAGPLQGKHIIEIGPGPGGLTRSLLLAGANHVTAIEFDSRAIAALGDLVDASEGRLTLLHGDALKIDTLDLVDGPTMIVANLPYNIATPLLTRWLQDIRDRPGCYEMMVLMFQKEVADRIAATPRSKTFGRLSVISQWLCQTNTLFDLPPGAFSPPPKVTSSVVRFIPKKPDPDAPSFHAVEAVTATAFGQRRKMLRACFKSNPGLLAEVGIDPTKRAEELDIADFIRLAKRSEAAFPA